MKYNIHKSYLSIEHPIFNLEPEIFRSSMSTYKNNSYSKSYICCSGKYYTRVPWSKSLTYATSRS